MSSDDGRPSGGHAPTPIVVYEDDAILVVDKPTGWAVALPPGPLRRPRTLTDWILARARRESPGRSRPKLKAASDLDEPVSGLVVFAKSPEAFDNLKGQFRTKRPHRIAMVVVRGHPKLDGPGACALEGTIRRTLNNPRAPMSGGRMPNKPAVTHFRLVRAWDEGCALRLRLETSHPRQVEDHLHSVGCWVERRNTPDRRLSLALHLTELAFNHPTTGELKRCTCRPPVDIARAFAKDDPEAMRPSRPARPVSADHPAQKKEAPDAGWNNVAEWYDTFIADRRSDHYDNVIQPGVLRLLDPSKSDSVLDIACGQGEFCRSLAERVRWVVGVDASPALLEAARERSSESNTSIEYLERDVRDLGQFEGPPFDGATCVMALMNIDSIEPVFRGIHDSLKDGGRLVIAILHPAFRQPGRSAWSWTGSGEDQTQERRVRAYLSEKPHKIVMNPAKASEGSEPICTTTHNRPIQSYVSALANAGFVIDALEEWVSQRRSESGPRANAENLARAEIPMFLAIRAIKPAAASTGIASESDAEAEIPPEGDPQPAADPPAEPPAEQAADQTTDGVPEQGTGGVPEDPADGVPEPGTEGVE